MSDVIRERRQADRPAVLRLAQQRAPEIPAHRMVRQLDGGNVTWRVDLVCERAAQLVGWASITQRPTHPRLLTARLLIAAEAQGQGIGSRLHDRLLENLPNDATEVRGSVIETDGYALAVVRHWGYEPYEACHVSRLDLNNVPPAAALPGVSFEASATLRFPDDDAVGAMLDRAQTNPERDHGLLLTLGMLRNIATSGAPIGVLARVIGEPVGLAHGFVCQDQLVISFLCVDPAFRGRGIAAAIKQRLHTQGATMGATHVLTSNEDANTAIRALNTKLGYRSLHTEIRVRGRCG